MGPPTNPVRFSFVMKHTKSQETASAPTLPAPKIEPMDLIVAWPQIRQCLACAALTMTLASIRTVSATAQSGAASPEMDRLARALVGDWNTTESMERSEYFPNGGERRGQSHWRLAAGGTVLVREGASDGSAGPPRYLITIWWDPAAKVYSLLTCFKGTTDSSSCRLRGTAQWIGDTFVNEYEIEENGKVTKWRDSFVEMTATSRILIAATDVGQGIMKTLITSHSVRR
jgi:hypothetical protein